MTAETSHRTRQAQETKRTILDAALRLFTAHGYGATSVNEIAKEAGVALPTVYASVGTKLTLLRLLLDRIDEMASVPDLGREIGTSTDPARILTLGIHSTRLIAERCGNIVAAVQSAAGVEPEMAQFYAAGLARHRAGAVAAVARIAELGALRPDLTQHEAAAILATLTGASVYAALTVEFHWTFDAVEAWLDATLRQQLLAPVHTQPRPGGSSAARVNR